ncbi:MAG: hypothetical protein A2648_02870 [Candidatus Lloydbacteria bacterium RIFCSPHIGHO2_01_FULL_41_20]|uniref:Uncharacterized protein n=1 Tax=Candidatus Lloydbacteria bacterium RIFCSPHIGHO2_01_FULL_41_20 TaxID=1798657 RepID=A0A1G2CTP7_9BACT|nr:MAG: hypothetical protein A2648_02870 [Candidatus Lloydbacteria bacterium RIFCSPHIGHO2_01_FULL_41_20]
MLRGLSSIIGTRQDLGKIRSTSEAIPLEKGGTLVLRKEGVAVKMDFHIPVNNGKDSYATVLKEMREKDLAGLLEQQLGNLTFLLGKKKKNRKKLSVTLTLRDEKKIRSALKKLS